jgi:hypothetical protein
MPTLSANANNLAFTAPGQQWIVESGVVVGSSLASPGAVVMPFANDELVNNGIAFVPQGTPFGGAGVFIGSGADGSKVTNASTGAITAPTGISVNAGGVHVANAGAIIGFSGIGIDFSPGPAPRSTTPATSTARRSRSGEPCLPNSPLPTAASSTRMPTPSSFS